MLADATSMHSTIQSIDSDYQCGNVSWNDKKRGVTENGSLSVFGSLINDASLADPEGHNFPFVRGDNHDEPLGVVRSSDITLIVGNTPTTLHEILKDPSFCKYRGFGELALGKKDGNGEVVDEKVVVRMQEAFVPMNKGETRRDVVVRNYSYATVSNDDPASLMLVGSPQGTHVHTDSLGDREAARALDGLRNGHQALLHGRADHLLGRFGAGGGGRRRVLPSQEGKGRGDGLVRHGTSRQLPDDRLHPPSAGGWW